MKRARDRFWLVMDRDYSAGHPSCDRSKVLAAKDIIAALLQWSELHRQEHDGKGLCLVTVKAFFWALVRGLTMQHSNLGWNSN